MALLLTYPDPNLIASALAIAIFLYFLFTNFEFSYPSRPPEAAGGWPILGHLHLLWRNQAPHVTLGAMAEKYGPVFTIRLGMYRALVVNSWELVKECCTTKDVAVASRPKQIGAEHLGYNYAQFGTSPYGPFWRHMRKMTALELLSSRRLEMLKHIRVSEVESSVKKLFEIWKDNKDASGKALVEMDRWLGHMNLNVVLRMVAGKRYYGTGDLRDDEEARRCQKVIKEFFQLMGMFVIGDAIPFLRWLDLGGHEKAMKRVARELDKIVTQWLEEKLQKRGSDEAKEAKDFMDVMISTLQSSDLCGYDPNTVNKATCVGMVAGGTDTITVTVIWILALLLNNRHVLKKVEEELDTSIGKERLVNESDLSNLVYLQAVIKEALRLYPVGPLGGIREVTEDCMIGGYHIPAGTRLIMNIWKIQTDPRVWPDPLEFKPERFLSTHKNVDVKGQHFELIPFGAGRRICPGMRLGLQMTHLVLATLLQAFQISAPSDDEVDMTGSFGLTYSKAMPLKVLVVPRLSYNSYK